MNAKKLILIPVFLFSFNSAMAGGLIGDIIEGACGNCGAGRALDEAHRNIGQPLDHAAALAAKKYGVPVSPYCATPQGVFTGPFLPINAPCQVHGMYGVVVGG